MNEFIGKNKFKLVILAISAVMILTAGSYAFFTAVVNGNEDSKATVVKSGVMEITYSDGQLIGTPTNMIPGEEVVKYFTVRNTGNVDTEYVIYLSEVINTFNPTTDLEYKLEKISNYGYETDGYVVAPTIPSAINDVAQSIMTDEEQEYKLTIKFKETGSNQDSNKGKKFQAKISINEYENATQTIILNSSLSITNTSYVANTLQPLGVVPAPIDEHDGYAFDGWYLDSDFETPATSSTIVLENLSNLYAKWVTTIKTCDVERKSGDWTATYECVGDVGTMKSCTYITTVCTGGAYGPAYKLYGCQESGTIKMYYYCHANYVIYFENPGAGFGTDTISCSCP